MSVHNAVAPPLYNEDSEDGMKKYGKFAALIVVVLGTLVYLAVAGGNSNAT
jgi:hypothetical protein